MVLSHPQAAAAAFFTAALKLIRVLGELVQAGRGMYLFLWQHLAIGSI